MGILDLGSAASSRSLRKSARVAPSGPLARDPASTPRRTDDSGRLAGVGPRHRHGAHLRRRTGARGDAVGACRGDQIAGADSGLGRDGGACMTKGPATTGRAVPQAPGLAMLKERDVPGRQQRAEAGLMEMLTHADPAA